MAQRGKFVIQPFKHNQQMDEDYANRTWQTLHDAIRWAEREHALPARALCDSLGTCTSRIFCASTTCSRMRLWMWARRSALSEVATCLVLVPAQGDPPTKR